ncbi:MAG: redox-regulated ATPase YchF [Deltaproteobacteria bacterium]|nr:redox-regulated ATPase YchF [Deltaproteobacteria bacterium]
MKLAIIGLPESGRSTIFAALSGARGEASQKDQRVSAIKVMDERIDFLSNMYSPKKTTYAQVECLLPSETLGGGSENAVWNQARICDALIHVVRNFTDAMGTTPDVKGDFRKIEDEMILSDLMVVDKRLERIDLDLKRGKKPDEHEHTLLKTCKEMLESGQPLRMSQEIATSPVLRGFTFLSSKPQLVIVNNDDDNESLPALDIGPGNIELSMARGRLEMDIASMTPEEAKEFLVEYHIEKSALDRVIRSSYSILNLISFFTVGEDEVKAWTIKRGTHALDAAGEIHSDIQKGFIRAEVLSYADLLQYGSHKEAKKVGRVRLEGKEYIVEDGDIINFRFNV